MPAIDRSAIIRECGARDRVSNSELLEQDINNRPDIASGGRIERGAVFEIELSATDRVKPFDRLPRLTDRLFNEACPRLQTNDDGVNRLETSQRRGDADCLNCAEAALYEVVG